MNSRKKKMLDESPSDEIHTKRAKAEIQTNRKRPRSYLKFLEQIAQSLEVKNKNEILADGPKVLVENRTSRNSMSSYKRGCFSGDQITYCKWLEIRKMIGVGHTMGDLDFRRLMSVEISKVSPKEVTNGTNQPKDQTGTNLQPESPQELKSVSKLDSEGKEGEGSNTKNPRTFSPNKSGSVNITESLNQDSQKNEIIHDLEDISSNSSTVSLSSREGSPLRAGAPLDGWNSPIDSETKLSTRSTSPLASPKEKCSWESRVEQFISSVGGDLKKRENSFVRSVIGGPPMPPDIYPPIVQDIYAQIPGSTIMIKTSGSPIASTFPTSQVTDSLESNINEGSQGPIFKDKYSIKVEASETEKEIVVTPMIRAVSKILGNQKIINEGVFLSGYFRYNLLSLASRLEWCVARALEMIASVGYGLKEMTPFVAAGSSEKFESTLREAIDKSDANLRLTRLELEVVHHVINGLSAYFFGTNTSVVKDEPIGGHINVVRARGIGSTLKKLAQEKSVPSNVSDTVKNSLPPPSVIQSNPWANMWNMIKTEHLSTFNDLRNYLGKSILGSINTCKTSPESAFDTAKDFVACMALSDLNLGLLQQMVRKAQNGTILPFKRYSPDMGRLTFHDVIDKVRPQVEKAANKMLLEDLEFLVRKTLVYVARGINRMEALRAPQSEVSRPIPNIEYNYHYLPPGLHEEDKSADNSEKQESPEVSPDSGDEAGGEIYPSQDPLNRVIDPVAGSHRQDELPYRKYKIVAVHMDWIVINGVPQIFELSLYTKGKDPLDMYVVTDQIINQKAIMSAINFVANPDRREYYSVQVGFGCVKALWKQKAFEEMEKFLEEIRNSSESGTQNNGLVLVFRGEEDVSLILSELYNSGHNDLMLDVVKGLGSLEKYVSLHKSSNISYSGPTAEFNVEGFYSSEVVVGIQTYNFSTKSKAQSLYKTLELCTGKSLNYKNFIHPCCFPSFGPQSNEIRTKEKRVRELYPVEMFIAASLGRESGVVQGFQLVGIYEPSRNRDLRDKASIIASKFCIALVNAGFDKQSLKKCFKRDANFSINSNIILSSMAMGDRLLVTEQTIRCIQSLKEYFVTTQDRKD